MSSNLSLENKQRKIIIVNMLMHRDLTMTELAAKLNVSTAFVSQLISGKRRSKIKEGMICKVLGVQHKMLWQ